jgi:hypothetical protein
MQPVLDALRSSDVIPFRIQCISERLHDVGPPFPFPLPRSAQAEHGMQFSKLRSGKYLV